MGKTPRRVVELLRNEIPGNISRNQFCLKTGINQNSVDKYMAGVAEPTQKSLQKIAEYFGVSVAFLRGEETPGITYALQSFSKLNDTMYALCLALAKDYPERADYIDSAIAIAKSQVDLDIPEIASSSLKEDLVYIKTISGRFLDHMRKAGVPVDEIINRKSEKKH